MADQAGRVAIVTGAGRGLGRAIALALATRDATVAAVARSEGQLAETAGLAGSGRIVPYPCDVTDPAAVAGMAERVATELGTVTILVNAAGVFGPIALIRDVDPREWARTIAVNTLAPFYMIRAVLDGMLAEGWGRIVSLSSAASLHPPGALNSAYGVSKVALNQLTRHLAAEIAGTGVTANVIHPGDVKTEMWADIRDRAKGLGPIAENYNGWVAWVDETGGDPPQKAADLVLRLTADAGAATNGQFCWIEDSLQPQIPSWDPPADHRPWMRE